MSFDELDACRPRATEHTLANLNTLVHPHSQVIEDEGRLYVTDNDVLPPGPPPHGLFGLIIGKVPAPPCVRGRFWNCSQGRTWKSFMMGRPSLNSSRNLDNWDADADANAEEFIPWDEATFFGRGAFDDSKLTAHGWGVTDLTLRPRPFASNPSKQQRKAGWARIQRDILCMGTGDGPRLLFFVYKKVLDWIIEDATGRKGLTKYGMNDHLPDEIMELFGPQKPHLYVFPMPGTQCTFRKPVAKGKVYCDKEAEEAKLAAAWEEWQEEQEGAAAEQHTQ